MRESEIGRWRRRLTAGALVLAVGLATGAHAATITVDATVDAVANDGNCTLREAILAANGDTAVDACAAGSGADVVVVPAGTYILTGAADEDGGRTGDLDITDDLELVGAGAQSTVIWGSSGSFQFCPFGCMDVPILIDRVLDVDPAGAGISARVSGITLAFPSSPVLPSSPDFPGFPELPGELARNRGTLVLADCMVTSKIVSFPGGGEAAAGDGIASAGPLRIERSIITGSGYGIRADGGATILNTTITGNGSGIVAAGTLELSNATIAENRGTGVSADTLVLRNSIVAGNGAADCAVGSTVGNAYNIDGDGSCGLSGTDQPRVAPLLGLLADNGGPTLTQALLAGSPAIEMGSPAVPGSGGTACEATDQRGVARPVGERCDVGAFEGTDDTISAPYCGLVPRAGCQTALAGRSKLALDFRGADTANELSWSWVSSAAVPVGEFGDPAAGGTGYTVCLYGAVPYHVGPSLEAIAPAGGTCGTRPCWEETPFGFRYTDQFVDPDGLKKIVLRAGASVGKAKITVKGRGANLETPFPFGTPVRVQLLRHGAPTCWEATFSTSTRNDFRVFKARSDP